MFEYFSFVKMGGFLNCKCVFFWRGVGLKCIGLMFKYVCNFDVNKFLCFVGCICDLKFCFELIICI